MIRKILIPILIFLFTISALAEKFPKGSEKLMIWDYAKILSKVEKKRLQESLKEFEKKHNAKFWVVTVKNLDRYDSSASDIEYYAHALLEEKLLEFGSDENSMLFLVSKGDRRLALSWVTPMVTTWMRSVTILCRVSPCRTFERRIWPRNIGDGAGAGATQVQR